MVFTVLILFSFSIPEEETGGTLPHPSAIKTLCPSVSSVPMPCHAMPYHQVAASGSGRPVHVRAKGGQANQSPL